MSAPVRTAARRIPKIYHGITACRLCGGKRLHVVLDLGVQALTGIFPKSKDQEVAAGPLQLCKCARCQLVQLKHNYELAALYGDTYGYRSGLNQSMVRHLRQKVAKILTMIQVEPSDVVIDIGSNDSTLLQTYPKDSVRLVGVDPLGPKFKRFYPPHIELIPDFFSASVVKRHLLGKKAKVITSIAMFYDLERPLAFVHDIEELLHDDGIWVFEQSYLPMMLKTNSYDTVCHEHLEYYALEQIKYMTDRAGLKIIDVEFNDVNGGSFSVAVAKKSSRCPEASVLVDSLLRDEAAMGLGGLEVYRRFARDVVSHRNSLRALLNRLIAEGKRVYGYGASTKGNVVLQYCGLGPREIPCIAEVNEDKFGAYTPGTRIPIISEPKIHQKAPDYLLVLPWHFRDGIIKREQSYLEAGGRLVFPLPRIDIVSASGVEVVWQGQPLVQSRAALA